jgi:hypothetical protein
MCPITGLKLRPAARPSIRSESQRRAPELSEWHGREAEGEPSGWHRREGDHGLHRFHLSARPDGNRKFLKQEQVPQARKSPANRPPGSEDEANLVVAPISIDDALDLVALAAMPSAVTDALASGANHEQMPIILRVELSVVPDRKRRIGGAKGEV